MKDYNDILMHAGVRRKSGRYKWGSGEHPYQHEPWFIGWGDLHKQGLTTNEIAKQFGMSQKELNARYGYAKDAVKAANIAHAIELRNNKQMSVKAIAEKMGVSQSTVKSWLEPGAMEKTRKREDLADALAKEVSKKKYIDVGKGVEVVLGCKRTMLEDTITILKDRGYNVIKFDQAQASNPQQKTHMMVLMGPKEGLSDSEAKSASYKELMQNKDKIDLPYEVRVNENGNTIYGIHPPVSIDSKRIQVKYAEEGGIQRDGLIEIRRGVDDLQLGNSRYAQVRIAVDGTHYIKGMCVYKDNMPDGVDIIFNTNKKKGTPLTSDDPKAKTVLKPMERDADGNIDKENPFGAQIKSPGGQYFYTDKNGNKQLGAINKVNSEEDWNDWTSSKTLASQILSKQSTDLAKRQLNLAHAQYQDELSDIRNITNPVVKEQRLIEFADSCDKAAVHMKAAALPGQSVKVLIPIPSLKDDEVYCPQYDNGDKLALFRYPHGSKAEIPLVTVNNSSKEGRKVLTNQSFDAIGISPKTAERLSGADFDGDTVVVIPNKKGWIKNEDPLPGMKDFDPHSQFANPPGTPKPNQQYCYKQMGVVTNLITDMTLQGAEPPEIARAVKHSMVVIDAYKHNLNLKASESEFNIKELHEKYQGKKTGGAYTVISKASGQYDQFDRDRYKINPETGEKDWHYTEKRRVDFVTPEGKKYFKELTPAQQGYDPNAPRVTFKSTKMAEAKDAMELVSPDRHPMEIIYANYANSMKALANEARKESLSLPSQEYNKSAAQEYSKEVESLKSKIASKEMSAPLERKAQLCADVIVRSKMKEYPDRYSKSTPDGKKNLGKLRQQVLRQQRALFKPDTPFDVTDREWEAIQSGAVNKTTLLKVLRYADKDRITKLSTPNDSTLPTLSPANISHARAMLNSGYTQKEVANAFGVSVSTLTRYLK